MDPTAIAALSHPVVQAALAQAASAGAQAASSTLPPLNLPAPMRSNTGVPDMSDAIDDNIFSSGVYANAANGELPLFSVPFGGNMLVQPVGTVLAAHQTRYDDTTTVIKEAGRLGSLGDASARSVSVSLEQQWAATLTGIPNSYGMGQQETMETLSKVNMTLKIATREYIHGGARHFPALSGAKGFASSAFIAAGAGIVSVITNGDLSCKGRRLNINIRIGRADTIEAKLRVTSGASLTFGAAGAASGVQPSLLWVEFLAFLARDVR